MSTNTPLITVEGNEIPIVASTDDNYAMPLSIMFLSVISNCAEINRLHFFVIDGGVTEDNKDRMRSDVVSKGAKLTFLEVNKDVYSNFPTKAHISAPAYYRISIPELFNDSVLKCIYLDCDVIVKGDIQDLWQVDLEGHAVGAVENISKSTYLTSKLDQQDYFNSGVLLINLDAWRQQGIPDKVRRFKLEHPELISTNDQCALNGVFRGDWKRLPIYWNHQSGIYRSSKQVDRLKQSQEFEKCLWNPSIIHYIGWSKPWLRPCFHPLEGEFRRYHSQSVFSKDGLRDVPKNRLKKRFSLFKKLVRQFIWRLKYRKHGYPLFK